MSLKKIIKNSLAVFTTLTALSSAPAYAIDVIPGPGAQKEAKELAAKKKLEEQNSQYATHNQDLLWIDKVDNQYFLRANITEPVFLDHGTGVGNLIAAVYDHPEIQSMDHADAEKLILNSNLNGVKFKDIRFRQLQSCLIEQVDRQEVINADPSKTTDVWSYRTHNLLLFNTIAGSEQNPPINAQVSCELDGYFIEELNQRRNQDINIDPINIQDQFHPEKNIVPQPKLFPKDSSLGSFDSIDSIVSNKPSDEIPNHLPNNNSEYLNFQESISKELGSDSAYVILKKSLREQDNSLVNYTTITIDQKQATYDLFQQVSNGAVQISDEQRKELAIDVYNVLGDQKSEYFISIKQIKEGLNLNADFRSLSYDLGGIGRREQLNETKNRFRDQLANLYQTHLQTTNSSDKSFSQWKKQMREDGASRYDLKEIFSRTPV
jgi:hypothetical protein